MRVIDNHPLVYAGAWGDVRYFRRPNGRCEAEAFYESLSEREQAQFLVRFRRIAADGKLFNESQYRLLHGTTSIYEFKIPDHRVTCAQCKRTWFLLHGFPKKGKQTREVKVAKSIKQELDAFLARGGREVCREW